jgi:hypothetical protein
VNKTSEDDGERLATVASSSPNAPANTRWSVRLLGTCLRGERRAHTACLNAFGIAFLGDLMHEGDALREGRAPSLKLVPSRNDTSRMPGHVHADDCRGLRHWLVDAELTRSRLIDIGLIDADAKVAYAMDVRSCALRPLLHNMKARTPNL